MTEKTDGNGKSLPTVVAFVGPSGTGKSHRALLVAHENNIDTIIDDGLLIRNGRIIAGRSAKSEPNRMRAVKRAVFMDEEHAGQVRAAIERHRIRQLLVLGTSEHMIERITSALGLPQPRRYVRIEEHASSEDMAKAREMRAVHGRHIIPVPNIELKKQSFGYYVLGKIEDMVRWRTRRRKDDAAEKSVVRPAFSYYGKLDITDSAIEDMVRQIVENESDGWQLLRVQVHNAKSEEKSLKINVDLASVAGRRLDLAAGELQLSLKDRLEFMTGMIVNAVNARIVRILTAKE